MIIINKNEGEKIPYEVNGDRITFDDDLTINLKKREDDSPVHIEVCYDAYGELVIGAAAGRRYVAEIDIPARQYTEGEADPEAEGENEFGTGLAAPVPVPFDIDKVMLTLWAIV